MRNFLKSLSTAIAEVVRVKVAGLARVQGVESVKVAEIARVHRVGRILANPATVRLVAA